MGRLLGRHAEARALLLAELKALPDADTTEGVTLKLMLATSLQSGSLAELGVYRAWAEEALAAARRDQDTTLCGAALAYASVSSGDTKRAVQRVREATPLFDSLPEGWSELHLERYDDVICHVKRELVAEAAPTDRSPGRSARTTRRSRPTCPTPSRTGDC